MAITPNTKLAVNGGISLLYATGGDEHLCRNAGQAISLCSSSIRYKRNVNPFNPGLALIDRLRPVSFNWKAANKEDLGLIAEEVAEVEPLLVTHNDKGEIEGVKYDRVGVVLINAIKEQQAQIGQLERERARFRTELAGQCREIESLRRLICLGHKGATPVDGAKLLLPGKSSSPASTGALPQPHR